MRAHSILLSARGYTIEEIADIYNVYRDTVSSWFDRWEQSGFKGLTDKSRSGRPPILTKEEREKVLELIKKYPQSIMTVISKLFKITGKIVSTKIIRRLAKAAGLTWKRIRKSLKSKRNQKEFEKAQAEISELEKQQDEGIIKVSTWPQVSQHRSRRVCNPAILVGGLQTHLERCWKYRKTFVQVLTVNKLPNGGFRQDPATLHVA